MQEKSHNKSPFFSRVETLRIKGDLSWDQVAEILGVNRSYLFHIKAGRKEASAKLTYRLQKAEIEHGIRPPDEPSRSHDRQEKQGDSVDFPIPGPAPAPDIQSLETRLAAVEADLKEVLKILREKIR